MKWDHYLYTNAIHRFIAALSLNRQSTQQGGKVITFTLVDASGRATNTQPVWAQWNYDVAGLLGEKLPCPHHAGTSCSLDCGCCMPYQCRFDRRQWPLSS